MKRILCAAVAVALSSMMAMAHVAVPSHGLDDLAASVSLDVAPDAVADFHELGIKEAPMHVKIHTAAVENGETPISNEAASTVRMGFNPSSLPQVDRIKALAAALISEVETIRDEGGPGEREASIAITEVQTASMFAVAAATAKL